MWFHHFELFIFHWFTIVTSINRLLTKLLGLLIGLSLVDLWLHELIIIFLLTLVISPDVVRGPLTILIFYFEVLIGNGCIWEVLGVIVDLDKSITLIAEPGSTVDSANEAESEHSTGKFPDLFLESLHFLGLSLGHLDALSAASFSIGVLL